MRRKGQGAVPCQQGSAFALDAGSGFAGFSEALELPTVRVHQSWDRHVSIEFDSSRHPLLIVRLGSAYSNAEWNRMLVNLIESLERGPCVAIADLRKAQMPNALQRRSFIDMYERHDRLTRAHFLALCGVGDSTLLRGVITALNWLRPAPHPVEVFAHREAAERWVLAQLPEPLRQRVPPAPSAAKGRL